MLKKHLLPLSAIRTCTALSLPAGGTDTGPEEQVRDQA
jgi:hypothetical protein